MIRCEGLGASEGIAIGPALRYQQVDLTLRERIPDEKTEMRIAAWERCRSEAKAQLEELTQKVDAQQAAIFEVHMDLLEDAEIDEMVRSAILEEGYSAEWAVHQAFSTFQEMIAQLDDEIIAGRAADLDDVCRRVLYLLKGVHQPQLDALDGPVILVADDLLPSDTAQLDRKNVLAIVTQTGGVMSHSAILARSFGIPAVLGIKDALDQLGQSDQLIVDGGKGIVIADPTPEMIEEYRSRRLRIENRRQQEERYREKPAFLADDTPIQIGLNIGSPKIPEEAGWYDFVGLLRTEFLYMESDHLPTEEEQFEAYSKVLTDAGTHPVTLRTLDIGGDKTLSYFELPQEENPFLGKRALRLCFDQPQIFRTQLRAALRASVKGKLQIMFPMVGSIDDIDRAKAFVRQVMLELKEEKIPYDETIPLGIMIEIPSIAAIADLAAAEVDFASIGTNDLCQYACAVDRMNPELADYYQTFSPAFLRMLHQIIGAFCRAGKEISICGEMAGDPQATALLAGMGLKKFSASAASLPRIKREMSMFTLEEAHALTQKALQARTQSEVVALVESARIERTKTDEKVQNE